MSKSLRGRRRPSHGFKRLMLEYNHFSGDFTCPYLNSSQFTSDEFRARQNHMHYPIDSYKGSWHELLLQILVTYIRQYRLVILGLIDKASRTSSSR